MRLKISFGLGATLGVYAGLCGAQRAFCRAEEGAAQASDGRHDDNFVATQVRGCWYEGTGTRLHMCPLSSSRSRHRWRRNPSGGIHPPARRSNLPGLMGRAPPQRRGSHRPARAARPALDRHEVNYSCGWRQSATFRRVRPGLLPIELLRLWLGRIRCPRPDRQAVKTST